MMSDIATLEAILKEIERLDGVSDAMLVARTGQYIAGQVPEGAYQDIFVAMVAILLGAAETATNEMKDRLEDVVIHLERSKIIIVNDGPKALFVLNAAKTADTAALRAKVASFLPRIEENL